MSLAEASHFLVVGAGAAGLMAARTLARAGKRVTLLEARDRCGGRIWPLPAAQFGYQAEAGAEFVHGAAEVTRALLREAGLSLAFTAGRRWRAGDGRLQPDRGDNGDMDALERALETLEADMPVSQFLATRLGGEEHRDLRRSVTRMVEGYDAADPERASTFALRDEWMQEGPERQGRLAEGYGALIDFLEVQCRATGVTIRLGAEAAEIREERDGIVVACRDGSLHSGDAVILAVPLPLLAEMALPAAARAKAATAVADIGYGNVVKILLRFTTPFWTERTSKDLFFLFSEARVPTWWTQYPAPHPVLTGWLAGPRAGKAAREEALLVETALAGLSEIFALPAARLQAELVAARAVNWAADPFARGAYSYATPQTRATQAAIKRPDTGRVLFSGEAVYDKKDMGTVEAALASGLETAQMIIDGGIKVTAR